MISSPRFVFLLVAFFLRLSRWPQNDPALILPAKTPRLQYLTVPYVAAKIAWLEREPATLGEVWFLIFDFFKNTADNSMRFQTAPEKYS